MKNIKTKVIATSLATLMAVSAVSVASVSAAETTQETTRTYYFVDNKDWGTASCYSWDVKEDGTVVEESSFPGTKLEAIGTTDVVDGKTHTVYEVEVKTSDDYFVISEGCDHGQQTNDISNHLFRDGANMIYLSADNDADFRHFDESDIKKTNEVASFASARQTANTRTLYFINNKGWDTVNAYTWEVTEDGVSEDAAFPGVPVYKIGTTTMLDGETAYDLYKVEVPATTDGIVFNEGTDHGQQTKDIDLTRFYNGANVFYLDCDNFAQVRHMDESMVEFDEYAVAPLSTEATVASASEVPAARTLYFINNKGWDKVNAYTWNNVTVTDEDGTTSTNTEESLGAFPGLPINKLGTTTMLDGVTEYEIYIVSVPSTADGITFVENGDNYEQSSDIDLTRFYDGANVFYLDTNNTAEVRQFDATQVTIG